MGFGGVSGGFGFGAWGLCERIWLGFCRLLDVVQVIRAVRSENEDRLWAWNRSVLQHGYL